MEIQQPDYSKKYYLKIILLILIGAIAELVVWFIMIREESVDWIGQKVLDQPYEYAITNIEDGRTVIGNVVEAFEVTTPAGFTVVPTDQPAFLYKEGDEAICRIETNLIKHKTAKHVEKLIANQENDWIKTYAGINIAYKQEKSEAGEYGYNLRIPINNIIVEYYLTSNSIYKDKCMIKFDQIRNSFIYY